MGGGFDEWLRSPPQFNRGGADPGFLPTGATEFLRELFDSRGSLSAAEAEKAWNEREEALARSGVAAFVADVRRTTSLRPTINVWRDSDGFLIVDYDGSYSAPVFSSIRDPEALSEIADNLADHVIDEVWGPWPLCPVDGGSTTARVLEGEAVWYCVRGSHASSRIGEMLAPTDASHS